MWSSRGKPTLLRGPPHLQETQGLPFGDPRTFLTVKGRLQEVGWSHVTAPWVGVGVPAAAGGPPVILPGPTCPHEMFFAALNLFSLM